jgi:hypothetical protein
VSASKKFVSGLLLKNAWMVTEGQKPSEARWYLLVCSNDQESTLGQTVQHLAKSRDLKFILIVSQETVSQKDQLKVWPGRIEQQTVTPPLDSLLQAFSDRVSLFFRPGPKIESSKCLRYLFQATSGIDASPGFVEIHRIDVSGPYFKFGQALKTPA